MSQSDVDSIKGAKNWHIYVSLMLLIKFTVHHSQSGIVESLYFVLYFYSD